MSATAQVEYKCTELYDPADEVGITWDDPDIGIRWPITDPLLSARDSNHPTLAQLRPSLVPVLTPR